VLTVSSKMNSKGHVNPTLDAARRTSTRITGRRALSAAGRSIERAKVDVDLVDEQEAAGRMGLTRSGLVESLAKRKRAALVTGTEGWLVDLVVLAEKGREVVPVEPVRIIEAGDRL
jgi:hypothetical protein